MQKDEEPFDLAALEEGQTSLEGAAQPVVPPPAPADRGATMPDENAPPGDASSAPAPPPAPPPPAPPAEPLATAAPISAAVPPPATSPTTEPSATTPAAVAAPAAAPPEPPPKLDGLTATEVADRVARGLVNVDTVDERGNGQIIRENTLTFFNIVLGSLIAILFVLAIVDQEGGHAQDGLFVGIVVLANVAVGTIQEIRAAKTLRALVALTSPRATVVRGGAETSIPAEDVVQGDLILLGPGDQVVADGHILADRAELDESLLTGEAASVRKGPGDELLSGSFATAGRCYYTAEKVGPEAYAQRLTADARQVVRRETPLQIRFRRILRVLLIATAGLGTLLLISSGVGDDDLADAIKNTTATISSVVPEGLLLGMTVAFAVGAVRLSKRGAIVQDIHAVEAMNYVDVVCLDKTGTITANKLTLQNVEWTPGAESLRPWLGAFASATADESRTATALADGLADVSNGAEPTANVPFSSERRWSALQLSWGSDQRVFVLGAPETLLPHCGDDSSDVERFQASYDRSSAHGLRGVLFAEAAELPNPDVGLGDLTPLALLTVADVLRGEVADAFATMAELEVEPKIISGDNPDTVASLIQQLGITLKGGAISGAELAELDHDGFREAVESYSVFGRIEPAQKARIVTALREQNHYVAMIGDGANDVQALRAADVAVAMESGTQTARGVAGIILLNDSFAAFVSSTAEAQAVLGNSVQLSKLFITKSFYAFLIIIASELLGLDFPFLPRHGSLTALFTLGIPSVFIAATKPPPSAGHDFTNSVLRFALPASLALAAASVAVHLLTQGFLDRPVEDSRTLVSLTIGIVGIYFMVQVIGFDGVRRGMPFKDLRRPVLTTLFGVALLALFLLTVYTPWLRSFFDFGSIGVDEWGIVVPAIVAAMIGQYAISRYWREIVAWIIKQPSEDELSRGRAV